MHFYGQGIGAEAFHTSLHTCKIHALANIVLSVCVSGSQMCICLNIGLYLVSSVTGRCAEESCTCLAVADSAMSRGCLISPVNPVSLCWISQGKQRKGVT